MNPSSGRSRLRISAATVVVALSIIAAIGVILWVLSIVRTEPPVIDPTPTATMAGTPESTPGATPSIELSPGVPELPLVTVQRIDRGSLPEMLQYAPDRLADDSLPLNDVAQYADIQGWMRAREIGTPLGPDDPLYSEWKAELDNLAIPSVLRTRGIEDVWIGTYGFGLHDVHQILAVGQAPDFVIIMRGDFSADALQAAWAESGYQAIRSQDVTIWSLFPGDAVDLSAPASRPALGNMNNLVVLEDGTVIATSRLARLEQAIRATRGEEPSLDENADVAALLAPATYPRRIDTALILKGTVLATDPSTPVVMATPGGAEGRATPDSSSNGEEMRLPRASLMLASLSVDGVGAEPRLSLVFSFETADDATRAMMRAERTIRMADSPVTGEPYAARIALGDARLWSTAGDPWIVQIRATTPEGPGDWLAMINERDLGFVMWPWEP